MNIRNFNQLALSPLRTQALHIIASGLAAIHVPTRFAAQVHADGVTRMLSIAGFPYILSKQARVWVVGIGSGTSDGVAHLITLLGEIVTGVCMVNVVSDHAAQGVLQDMLSQATEEDIVLCVLGKAVGIGESGAAITPEQFRSLKDAAASEGVSPQEQDIIFKHLSWADGGRLAALAYPTRVVVFNVVHPTQGLSPFVLDPTTVHMVRQVLHRYNILTIAGLDTLTVSETPKEEKYFSGIQTVNLWDPEPALLSMQHKAQDLGWQVQITRGSINDAQSFLDSLGSMNKAGLCTIFLESPGVARAALAHQALGYLKEGQVFSTVSLGGQHTYGTVGVLADKQLTQTAQRLGIFSEDLRLQGAHDAFFEQVGGHIEAQSGGAVLAGVHMLLSDV